MRNQIYLFLTGLILLLPSMSFADGNGTLGQTYTYTRCGLNYTTASQRLGQRFTPPGVPQPASFNITIPGCGNVIQAFLYAEGSGNGAAMTAAITGPAGTQNFPMAIIGTQPDKCWGYAGSYTYRADVTSVVTGSFNYQISGITVGGPPNDMDGATLIVIYRDTAQTYQGTIIINDGAVERSGGSATMTMNYPAVCGPTQGASAFMGIGDLQFNTNVITLNGTNLGAYAFDWWNYFQVNTTVNAGQTSSTYTTNDPSDCYNVAFIGLYYQTTSCAVCTPPVLTVNPPVTTPDFCGKCNGTATASASGGVPPYTYSWAPSGGNNATATDLCQGTYTCTIKDQCGLLGTVVATIDSAGGFLIDSSQVDPLCHGFCDGSATVTTTFGNPPFTYTWAPNVGNTATVNNLCEGTYIVTVKDADNCQQVQLFTLTQPPIVPGPNTYDVSYCQFETAAPLTAVLSNPSHTAQWYTQPTGGTGTATAPVPSTAVPGTFTWYVSEMDSTGCESSRVPANVIIKAKPSAPVVFNSVIAYCQYDTALQLVAIGDSLKWYTQPTGGSYSFVAPTPQTDVLGEFVWYVSQTVNGCESDRIPITIGVYQKPEPPVTVDVVYCQGDEASPLTAIGTDIRWYLLPVGGSAQPTPTPITTIPDTVTWYVSSNNHGCESDRTPLKVITKYRPSAHILYSNDSVCQFDTLTYLYSGYALDSAVFAWEWPEGAVVVSGNDSTRGPIVVRFDSTGPHKVSLVVTDNGCSSPRATVPVEVKVLPVAVIDMSSRNACKDDTITIGLSYANMGMKNYWWDFDGGITPWGSSGVWGADGGGPYYITWAEPGIHPIHLQLQGMNECYSRPGAVDTVNLHDRPEAKIEQLSADNICSGDSVRLSASTNKGGYSYQWSPVQFFDDGNNTAVVNAYIDFTRYVTLRVTNEYGCTNEDSLLIHTKPCCEIFMPDAFSPNGDGKNDLFRIVDLGRHPLTDFRIFNRWGEMVFNTADPNQGWDGSHEGVAQDMDVYYYIVKFKCDGKQVSKIGEVTLIR